MSPSELEAVLKKATVPEHSVLFMQAMSGGEPFLIGPYVFVAAEDWLVAVGYPLSGERSTMSFDEALAEAVRRSRAKTCWAISPSLPNRLRAHRRERDDYYVLPADAKSPHRLERLAERASGLLRVEEGNAFTAAHRRLWAEFVGRVALPSNVRELFAETEAVLQKAPGLVLLNAWDPHGHLAACLLLDTAPRAFLTYLIGAHSRTHYTPYASDLLFREMIRIARQQGKEFLHLGLGVNEGIRRFKTKWGGAPALPYEVAAWQEKETVRSDVNEVMRVLASSSGVSMSKAQILASLPQQRRFAMLWEVDKEGRRSWIGGTAHFFCYSFESSLRKLFDQVDTVLFEGPLDQASLDQVSEIGRSPESGSSRLIDALTEQDVRRLERVVIGPRGRWARLLGFERSDPPDVRLLLSETRHWMAFFSLWTSYLKRHGWYQSVDLEAWHLAHDMGKAVAGMETIAEQIETLESIPFSRVVNFFRLCERWNGYIRRNVRAYLKGDLEGMMGTSIEFPTRTDRVIHRRDAIFLERMKPFLEAGRCAVFVGTAHMLNLLPLLDRRGLHSQEASMIVPDQLARVTAQAETPEQVIPYVCAVSELKPRMLGPCVAYEREGEVVLVGYPLHDPKDKGAMAEAVSLALRLPGLRRITIIGPARPPQAPESAAVEEDWSYSLPVPAPPPGQKLKNLLRRAGRDLTIERGGPWGKDHMALVRRYLDERPLAAGTRLDLHKASPLPGGVLRKLASLRSHGRRTIGRLLRGGVRRPAHRLLHVRLQGASSSPARCDGSSSLRTSGRCA